MFSEILRRPEKARFRLERCTGYESIRGSEVTSRGRLEICRLQP